MSESFMISCSGTVTSKGSSWPKELPHKPWQPVFPHLESWLGDRLPVCSQLAPLVVRIPFVLSLLYVQLFCADFGRLSAKAVWRIAFSKEAG